MECWRSNNKHTLRLASQVTHRQASHPPSPTLCSPSPTHPPPTLTHSPSALPRPPSASLSSLGSSYSFFTSSLTPMTHLFSLNIGSYRTRTKNSVRSSHERYFYCISRTFLWQKKNILTQQQYCCVAFVLYQRILCLSASPGRLARALVVWQFLLWTQRIDIFGKICYYILRITRIHTSEQNMISFLSASTPSTARFLPAPLVPVFLALQVSLQHSWHY